MDHLAEPHDPSAPKIRRLAIGHLQQVQGELHGALGRLAVAERRRRGLGAGTGVVVGLGDGAGEYVRHDGLRQLKGDGHALSAFRTEPKDKTVPSGTVNGVEYAAPMSRRSAS